ncbi:MAG: phosphate ABC transporter ATP-binding protein [Clostridiales bacterium]|nr:phosphate ABC transporter ATP-binding protein [Clostridiales bacterium]
MDSVENAISIKGVTCRYGSTTALQDVSLDIPKNSIYSFIGPSGCGKTTLLRSLNRLNDLIPSFRIEGSILVEGRDIYAHSTGEDKTKLRRRIGMIFQQPNPLPSSIMKNLLLPVKEHYKGREKDYRRLALEKLKLSFLYDEIADHLNQNALSLSGGQQQRLCIARALMLEPPIMLFDEPCSALDPISTFKIEEMLINLKKEHSIIIVTHNMEQALRIADYTAFFYQGKIIEAGETQQIFRRPKTDLLARYITGRF